MVVSSIFLVTFIKIGFVSSRYVESLPDAMVSTNNQKMMMRLKILLTKIEQRVTK